MGLNLSNDVNTRVLLFNLDIIDISSKYITAHSITIFHNDAWTQIGIDFILRYFKTTWLHKKYDNDKYIKSKFSKFIEKWYAINQRRNALSHL